MNEHEAQKLNQAEHRSRVAYDIAERNRKDIIQIDEDIRDVKQMTEKIYSYLVGTMAEDGLRVLVEKAGERSKQNRAQIESLNETVSKMIAENRSMNIRLWGGLTASFVLAMISISLTLFVIFGG